MYGNLVMFMLVLTSFILDGGEILSTDGAIFLIFQMLNHTAVTEHFTTASIPVLLRVSGHTETDQTEKLIRRTSHPLTVIATLFFIRSHSLCFA